VVTRTAVSLKAEPVETAAQVEWLRQIRNVCREGFSHDTAYITREQQGQWWFKNKRLVRAWLYREHTERLVGFGMLRRDEHDHEVSSVAVLPECAGKGYGGHITADIIRRAHGQVYGTARLDNPGALALHRAEDWDVTGEDGRLRFFRTKAVLA
jgi:GNAT superfamily N-acetyltransferase